MGTSRWLEEVYKYAHALVMRQQLTFGVMVAASLSGMLSLLYVLKGQGGIEHFYSMIACALIVALGVPVFKYNESALRLFEFDVAEKSQLKVELNAFDAKRGFVAIPPSYIKQAVHAAESDLMMEAAHWAKHYTEVADQLARAQRTEGAQLSRSTALNLVLLGRVLEKGMTKGRFYA